MQLPSQLRAGDSVGIVSPSFAVLESEIMPALEILSSWHLKVVIYPDAFALHGQYAGTDEQRLHDLQEAINNPELKAIFCTRGGYGIHRIIDKLDFAKLIAHPKWIIGFSDITLLHQAIYARGIMSVHGPVLRQLSNHPAMAENVYSTLFEHKNQFTWQSEFPADLHLTAPLVGGNLTLLSTSVGTEYQLQTKDAILFLEEIGESAYRVDRMIQHLRLSGYFKHEKAIIIGSSTSNLKDAPVLVASMIQDICPTIPVLVGAPIGHAEQNEAIVMGGTYSLRNKAGEATLTFAAESKHLAGL